MRSVFDVGEDSGISRFPRKVLALMPRFCDRAGSLRVSPK